MIKVFCAPARYVQGPDATFALGQESHRLGLGQSAFLIAGPSAKRQLETVWDASFAEAGIHHVVIDFGGECSSAEIERLKTAAIQARAEFVVGAGGGKVLDTARAVAAALALRVVCCPTVAASDAPCSASSVVYTPQGEFEKYLNFSRNPDLVLVDTRVIVKAPVRLLIAGMGDALATRFEAETAISSFKGNGVGGLSTIAAAQIADLCYQTLLRDGVAAVAAARQGAVTPAFERIVEANTLLSGLGFESGGLAVAHSVHNGLTVAPETHAFLHGEKVAFGTLVQLVLEGRERRLIEEVMTFCLEVGLPIALEDLGLAHMSEAQAEAIAARAVAPGETAHNEPFIVTPSAIRDAIWATDALARDFKCRSGLVRA